MTDTEDEADDETAGRHGRQSDSPSEAADSRFGKFLDRLDEKETRLVESRGEDADASDRRDETTNAAADSDPTVDGRTTDSPQEANATPEPDADSDAEGWVWGPSAGQRDEYSESSEARPQESTSASGTDDGRIWDADPAERIDRSSTERTDLEAGESNVERDSTTEMATADTSSVEATETADELTEAEMRDRWFELGSSLGGSTDTVDRATRTDEETPKSASEDDREVSTSAETSSEERTGDGEDEWGGRFDDSAGEADDSPTPRASLTEGALSADLDRVSDASSVLVLGPTDHSVSDEICSRVLTGEDGSRNVLFVTFDDSPDDRIEVCHRADGWSGGQIGIIEVGRGGRSSRVSSEITGGEGSGSITTRHVSKPGDLSKLGIVITQLLSKFDETPRQTVLCFHTLSVLHREVGTKTLFRFLTTLQGRLNTADAIGHYHMDPDLHDEIVIETLRPIFDSVVRFSADGQLEIE